MPNNGAWGPVNSWPIIAINATLTPDGKVLSHGTDVQGQQGGMMYFDVWDPVTGQHQIMQHATHTDLFCSSTVIVPETGEVLIAGGDTRGLGGGLINFGVPDTNVYNWWDESLIQSNTGPMHHGRWYPTVVALSNGKIFVTGGVNGDNQGVGMPELYTPGSGWKELPGAYTNNTVLDWWYPRAWVSSNGLIYSFVTNTVNPGSKVMAIDPSGDGTLAEVGVTPFTNNYQLPAVMFEKDKILVIEGNGNAWIMDISGPVPTYQQTAAVGVHRFWSNLVVLADGSVMVSGGSAIENQLVGVNNQVRIWHPNTGQWTDGPEAAVPRLYHSTTLLLPDGRVLSAGGGAPGPLTNLNSEIYTPDYLLNDDGTLAARPAIFDGPTKVDQHAHFDITVDDGAQISRVTLVKFGNATHAFNMDQRKIDLPFEVHGNEIGIQLPDNPNVTTPGYWMLFVFNEAGAPSIARTIHIGVGGEFYSDQMKSFVTFNGYANYDAAENAFMITPDVPDLIGTVGTNQRVDLTKSFQISFEVNLGNKDLSADGISFVIHNSPWGADAVGFKGDGVGAVGIGNGIAIKLDSFQSGGPYNDVPGDHTNFVNTSAPPGAQDITGQVALGNINDGQWHNVEVTWDAATQTLFYYVDGKVASAIQQNISQAYLGGSNLAYLAFTGASGPGGNQQMVRVTNFNGVYEVKPDIVEPVQQIQNVSPPDNLGDIFVANPVDDIVGFLGSTVYVPQNQAVMLTGPVEGETGGMAFQQRVDFTHDFALQAQFDFSDKPIAGDGAAIVFHNDPRGLIALGNGGADFGAAGVQNGIGIALDTYKNDAPFTDQYANNTNFIDTSLGPAQRDLLGHQNPGNLKDGRWHVVQVFWDVQTQNLTYLVDGKVMGTLHRNLIADSFGGSNYAYLAITGATGGAATLQQMRINSLQAVFEPKPFGGQDPNDPNCVFDMRTLKDNVTFNGDALYDVGADFDLPDHQRSWPDCGHHVRPAGRPRARLQHHLRGQWRCQPQWRRRYGAGPAQRSEGCRGPWICRGQPRRLRPRERHRHLIRQLAKRGALQRRLCKLERDLQDR